ncbi:hypothetical protein TR51_25440 [Kitasatospora griseola]|uniref:Peptidase C1A papain C-terminal domain-containing protein n=1 Tax=Kitasatospora griseola TaxID=2064 RepID=A0A0D0N2V0_KITGR|nr:C1 family peptidase [Kitasatospora griseola]KIQ62395.1 hypothetical protein TR51_25440 [Kitasatospora griseola]
MYVERFEDVTDPRLGRHIKHDPRSLAFAHPAVEVGTIRSVLWERRSPILNQGNLGSCTGNALTGILGTDSLGRTGQTSVTVKGDPKGVFAPGTYVLDEAFAVKAYELNTKLDDYAGTYPPSDTGSNGLAAAKTGQALGLLSGYTHGFSIEALQAALQSGPVMWGTLWLKSMFNVDAKGCVVVDRNSAQAGGHELVISGYNVEHDVYTVQNSWGIEWGVNGLAYVSGADMAWLLSQRGDITVPQYATVAPSAADPDATFLAAVVAWLKAKGYSV